MTRKPRTPDLSLYTLQQGAESFIITKFDSLGLEMLSQYIMPIINSYDHGQHSGVEEEVGCTCPQGTKPTCRHRKMLPLMLDRIDTNWFFRYGTNQWVNMGNLANEAAELDDESIHAVEDTDTEQSINEEIAKDVERLPLSVPVAEPVQPAPTENKIPRRRVT